MQEKSTKYSRKRTHSAKDKSGDESSPVAHKKRRGTKAEKKDSDVVVRKVVQKKVATKPKRTVEKKVPVSKKEVVPKKARGSVASTPKPEKKTAIKPKKRKKRKPKTSTNTDQRGRALYPRTSSEKVLDHLAMSLRGPCECTAVAFLDGKFVIAANEFTSGSGTKNNAPNRAMDLMKKIMQYFADIAEKKVIDKQRKMELLLEISENLSTGATTKGRLNLPAKVIAEILDIVVSGNKMSMRAYHRKHREFATDAGYIYMAIKDMHISFCAMEKVIKETRDNPNDKGVTAIKSRALGYEIYTNSEKNTHAEARILEKIIMLYRAGKIKEKKIYIGISKLSCLDCRAMSESFNTVFAKKGIDLRVHFYGKHDYDFDTWPCPQVFREGYDQYCSDEDTMEADEEDLQFDNIEARIGYEAHRKSSEMRDIPRPAKFSQSYPQSESDVEFDVEQRHVEYKQLFQERIEMFDNLLFQDSHEKNRKLFIGLKDSPILLQLLEHIEESNDEKALRSIRSLCSELSLQCGVEIKIEELLALFKKDKIFAGMIGDFARRIDTNAIGAILSNAEKQEKTPEETPKKPYHASFFGSPCKSPCKSPQKSPQESPQRKLLPRTRVTSVGKSPTSRVSDH